MTKNELLAGFLDRSLSEDEMLEFEQLRASDSSFGHRVNDMMSVEKLLLTSTPVVVPPAQFLTSVEAVVASKVAAGAAGGFFSGLFSSAWTWIAAGSVAVIGAGAVYMNQPEPTVVAEPQLAEQVVAPSKVAPIREMPENVPSTATRAPAESKPSQRISSSTTSNPVVNDPTPDALGTPPKSADLKTEKMTPALEALVQDLDACRASLRHASCAQKAIVIGSAFQKNNDANSAIKYFVIALDEARASKIVDYQINAAGNLGVAARDGGRKDDAKKYLQEAIRLGQQNGILVDRWENALQSIR